jgi:hypothetical protein
MALCCEPSSSTLVNLPADVCRIGVVASAWADLTITVVSAGKLAAIGVALAATAAVVVAFFLFLRYNQMITPITMSITTIIIIVFFFMTFVLL